MELQAAVLLETHKGRVNLKKKIKMTMADLDLSITMKMKKDLMKRATMRMTRLMRHST
jgi:hypothetical protein